MGDVAVLKRIRRDGSAVSAAERLFLLAWSALARGAADADVARAITAHALAGARLGPCDSGVLARLGVPASVAAAALAAAGPDLADRFAPGLDTELPDGSAPAVAMTLCRQPRAGATMPGRRKLVLWPAESHGDHCCLVAVGGVLLSDAYGADAGVTFLAGLAHHLHNAQLPDAGFEGETLLGDALGPLIARLRAEELAALPSALAGRIRDALRETEDAGTPEGRAFNAADVIDRVQEVHHHAAVAAFRAEQAIVEMEIVHQGPLQAFQNDVLRRAGLC